MPPPARSGGGCQQVAVERQCEADQRAGDEHLGAAGPTLAEARERQADHGEQEAQQEAYSAHVGTGKWSSWWRCRCPARVRAAAIGNRMRCRPIGCSPRVGPARAIRATRAVPASSNRTFGEEQHRGSHPELGRRVARPAEIRRVPFHPPVNSRGRSVTMPAIRFMACRHDLHPDPHRAADHPLPPLRRHLAPKHRPGRPLPALPHADVTRPPRQPGDRNGAPTCSPRPTSPPCSRCSRPTNCRPCSAAVAWASSTARAIASSTGWSP